MVEPPSVRKKRKGDIMRSRVTTVQGLRNWSQLNLLQEETCGKHVTVTRFLPVKITHMSVSPALRRQRQGAGEVEPSWAT